MSRKIKVIELLNLLAEDKIKRGTKIKFQGMIYVIDFPNLCRIYPEGVRTSASNSLFAKLDICGLNNEIEILEQEEEKVKDEEEIIEELKEKNKELNEALERSSGRVTELRVENSELKYQLYYKQQMTGKIVRNKIDGTIGVVLREWETGQVQVLEKMQPKVINTHDSWKTLELLEE